MKTWILACIGSGLVIITIATASIVASPFSWITHMGSGRSFEQEDPGPHPYRGRIEAIDPTVQSVEVDGKTIYLSSQTSLTKNGQPILLTQIRLGDEAQGEYRMIYDAKREAVTMRIGSQVRTAEQTNK